MRTVSAMHLHTYLNDHLAGSVVAVELLDYLEKTLGDVVPGHFVGELRADISADQNELKALMAQLQAAVSLPRKAAAWMGEKLTQIKLRLDDPAGGEFRAFEVLEALSLGIEGKLSLWVALAAVTKDAPELQGVDFARLETRAMEQRKRVESLRIAVAKIVLKPNSGKPL